MKEEVKLYKILFKESSNLQKHIYDYHKIILFYKKAIRKKPYQKRAIVKSYYIKSQFNRIFIKKYLLNSYIKLINIKQYNNSTSINNYNLVLYTCIYLNYIKTIYRFIIILLLVRFQIFLVKYKPTSPATRHKKLMYTRISTSNFNIYTKFIKNNVTYNTIQTKKLLKTKKNSKFFFFFKVDFYRQWTILLSLIIDIKYSIKLQKFLALVQASNGSICLIKAVNSILVGDYTRTMYLRLPFLPTMLGYRVYLKLIKPGQLISDIMSTNTLSVTFTKAKGSVSKCLYYKQNLNLYAVSLPSGTIKYLNMHSLVTIGRIAGKWHKLEILGAAGFNIVLGKRQTVRGIAMNPVDHPHGGRSNSCVPEVSPWGWVTKYNK